MNSRQLQKLGVPEACVKSALMPDAHVGYGLPIGGVLALEGAVIPYAAGVDIACRMKLSMLDLPPSTLDDKFNLYREALDGGTRFGIGSTHETPQDHPVMDQDWSITRITREKKDLAWSQLGTSGSGNHVVDFGVPGVYKDIEDVMREQPGLVAVVARFAEFWLRDGGRVSSATRAGVARLTRTPAKSPALGIRPCRCAS